MRIAMLTEPRDMNGGIPKYSLPVAQLLAATGHEVFYISSGAGTRQFNLGPTRWRHELEDGINFYTLLNPASTGMWLGDPMSDIDNADVAKFDSLLMQIKPDVVHIHSFFGIPIRVVETAAAYSKVFVTVHEFGLICQQRVLVQNDGTTCQTYASQSDCAKCVTPESHDRLRLRYQLEGTMNGLPIKIIHAAERITGKDIKAERSQPTQSGQVATEQTSTVENGYATRLQTAIAIVNQSAAKTFAVSNSVRTILMESGMPAANVDVLHIGSGAAEELHRSTPKDSDEIAFLYLGGNVESKGIGILAAALPQLAPTVRIVMAGSGYESLTGPLKDDSRVSIHGRYDRPGLQNLLDNAHALLTPTVAPDTSPQVVFEAFQVGRPVIGSRLGGIPDFVTDGKDGILVTPEDPQSLAVAINRFAADAQLRRDLTSATALPRSLAQHVEALASEYATR